MDKLVWKGRIKEGMRAEYIRRHKEIWPEMEKALKDSGICNYSIWNCGNELFGYYECPDAAYAQEFKAKSDVMRRWSESMQHVMEMEKDSSGQNLIYQKVYELG